MATSTARERMTPFSRNFLITCIDDQIGILALELSPRKASQFRIELLVDLADRTRAKTVSAELFANRFDFPSRYSLDVHLRERRHQGFLAAQVYIADQ